MSWRWIGAWTRIPADTPTGILDRGALGGIPDWKNACWKRVRFHVFTFFYCWTYISGNYLVVAQNLLTHGLCGISTVLENTAQSWNLEDVLSGLEMYWKGLVGVCAGSWKSTCVIPAQPCLSMWGSNPAMMERKKTEGKSGQKKSKRCPENTLSKLECTFQLHSLSWTPTFSWDIMSRLCQEMPLNVKQL